MAHLPKDVYVRSPGTWYRTYPKLRQKHPEDYKSGFASVPSPSRPSNANIITVTSGASTVSEHNLRNCSETPTRPRFTADQKRAREAGRLLPDRPRSEARPAG